MQMNWWEKRAGMSPDGTKAASLTRSDTFESHISSTSSLSRDAAALIEEERLDSLLLFVAVVAWYLIGVGAIVTTKIILTDWMVPPVLLTVQQMILSSMLLRIFIPLARLETQTLPWNQSPTSSKGLYKRMWQNHSDFVLIGVYNALDFLASNTAFAQSTASFVETIKSSDPITTTAVALAWKVDRLDRFEAMALSLLIVGVLLSTWGNAQAQGGSETSSASLAESIRGSTVVMTANLCFAFRCMFQKRYRNGSTSQLNDINLLCRMQQTGALALLLPALLMGGPFMVEKYFEAEHDAKVEYMGLSCLNAFCYAAYNLASSYILSKLTVLQHSSLGCLRRMFAIVATCIFFGVPVTLVSALGLLTSFVGFFSFTYIRNSRPISQPKSPSSEKDSIV